MTIGERIRLYRENRGMTQVQLSTVSGINVGTIRKYELGIRNPKPDQLLKIAGGLGKNVSTFYDLNICTAGDIMTLLIDISEKAEVTFVGDTDGDGNYLSSEVAMKFTDPYMQELLSDWATMKHDINNNLEKLSTEPDEIKKTEKMRVLSTLYNGYMRILTDKGRVSSVDEPILDTPSSKGLKDCMPFNKHEFIKGEVTLVHIDDVIDD